MSGEARKVKSQFIPAPIDGLNLIANPAAFKATEARELQNYFVYDWGIRERGPQSVINSVSATTMYSFYDLLGNERMVLMGDDENVYLMDSVGDASPDDISGSVTITSSANVNICAFNKNLFFFNETDIPWQYDVTGASDCVTISYTGLGPANSGRFLASGWNYRSRLYAVEGVTGQANRVWYSGVSAIAGAMQFNDFGPVFDRPGHIVTGGSWGYNQGLSSDELFFVISSAGEVLFYSGDWPLASNWQLIGRAFIPKPTGRNCLVKIGQEILVSTARGVLPMSQIFAGNAGENEYYSLSRKLGPFGIFEDRNFSVDPQTPFLYGAAPSSSEPKTVFVQNYERGAWSTILVTTAPACIATFGGYFFFSNGDGTSRLEITGNGEETEDEETRCVWKTPFFDFGSAVQKQSKMIRLVCQNLSSDIETVTHSVYLKSNFIDDGTVPSTVSSATGTATDDGVYHVQELNCPGAGRRLSFCFSKIPDGERNEVYGFEAHYEEGGLY